MKPEIKLIYNSQKSKDKKAYAVVSSIEGIALNDLDISKTSMTEKQLSNVADLLGVDIHELFDEQSDAYEQSYASMSENDMLVVMKQNPVVLKTPIAIKNEETGVFLSSDKEAISMDLEIENNASRPDSKPNE